MIIMDILTFDFISFQNRKQWTVYGENSIKVFMTINGSDKSF